MVPIAPYRTYSLRICDKERREDVSEAGAIVGKWVEAIGHANEQRMREIEQLMQEERELHKGFLERRVRSSNIIRKTYKRRYFVLASQRLYYYSDINTNIGAVLKGKVDLKKLQSVVRE